MPESATIIIAREDFSIPGSEGELAEFGLAGGPERKFFRLLKENRPDVIVLALNKTSGAGMEAIRKIRERTGVPILVVHAEGDARADDYRVCGAGCIAAPIDIIQLNLEIRHIIELTKSQEARLVKAPIAVQFAGMLFDADQNVLQGREGTNVKLTTLENNVLSFLVSRARKVCSRAEIAQTLYGSHPPTTDRAIDVVVNRLRKKLATLDDMHGDNLIKTEFRRGYILVADISPVPTMRALLRAGGDIAV